MNNQPKEEKEVKSLFNSYNLAKFLYRELANDLDRKFDVYHIAIYFRLIEINNLCGWADVIQVPSDSTMEMARISTRRTYYQRLNDLVEFGMIKIVKKSPNQYQAMKVTLKTEFCLQSLKLMKADSAARQRLEKVPVLLPYASGAQANTSACASGALSKSTHIKHFGGKPQNKNEEEKFGVGSAVAPLPEENTSDSPNGTTIPTLGVWCAKHDLNTSLVQTIIQEKDKTIYSPTTITTSYGQTEIEKNVTAIVAYLDLTGQTEAAITLIKKYGLSQSESVKVETISEP